MSTLEELKRRVEELDRCYHVARDLGGNFNGQDFWMSSTCD